jgi:hypothetical protein
VGVGVAVRRVELGRDVRVVAGDRRVGVVTGHRLVDDVVGRRRGYLPAGAIEQQLGGRVVVDEELEADAAREAVEPLRLGLGVRAGAAVGLARRVGRGALVVVAPLVGEVAVQVDAVADRDLPVAVVVAQVLAPQPLPGLEGPVVAVGVRDRHEPQLARVHEPADRAIGVVAVEHVVHQPAVHLRRDPLARVLGGEVEHRRLAAVALPWVLGHLQGDDPLALVGGAVVDELRDLAVVACRLLVLLPQPAGPRVRPEDAVAGLSRACRGGLAADLLDAEVDALAAQLLRLAPAQDQLDAELAAGCAPELQLVAVDAELGERSELAATDLALVDLEPVSSLGSRAYRQQGDEHRYGRSDDALHASPPPRKFHRPV